MSWATVAQYQARYGAVDDTDTLQECLNDATAQINDLLDTAHIDYFDPTEQQAYKYMMVCRQMANRMFESASSALPFGATQAAQTAGPYTQSFSFGNPYGTVQPTRSEKALLGVLKTTIGSIRPAVDGLRNVTRCGDVLDY